MTDKLIPLRLKSEETENSYASDVEEIRQAAASAGYEISATDARLAWERYSETMAAGWMMLEDTPGETWSRISHYFEA